MPAPASWSELYRHRRAAEARFGGVFELPLARRAYDVLLEHLADGASLLEVGAGPGRLQALLAERRPRVTYQSLDPDPRGSHDYRDLAEVRRTFDCLAAFEVVEHLPLDEIPSWLTRLRERVTPGGLLVLSTPNTFYPPAYLRDATHRTPLCYDELAGLATAAGWQVETVVRIHNDPLHRLLLRRFIFGWLFRLIGIDYAPQIVLVARNPHPPPAAAAAG